MATPLAELEERLQALEEEMASLRELVQGYAATEHATRRLGESRANPAELQDALAAVYQKMGISGEAPGMQQLRALLAAHGVHPGDEIVRQEIATMRQQEEDE
jgi:flagellar motility protein MotE (MotC chaperone)